MLRSHAVSRHGQCPALTAHWVAQITTRLTMPPHTTPGETPHRSITHVYLTWRSISLARHIHSSIHPFALPLTPSLSLFQQTYVQHSSNPTDLPLSSRLCTPPLRPSPRSTEMWSGHGVPRVAGWHPFPPSSPPRCLLPPLGGAVGTFEAVARPNRFQGPGAAVE
jgi:hypothetical protein